MNGKMLLMAQYIKEIYNKMLLLDKQQDFSNVITAGIMEQDNDELFIGTFSDFRLLFILEGEALYKNKRLIPGDLLVRHQYSEHKLRRICSDRGVWEELFITIPADYAVKLLDVGIFQSDNDIFHLKGSIIDPQAFAYNQLNLFSHITDNNLVGLTTFLVQFSTNLRFESKKRANDWNNPWLKVANEKLKTNLLDKNRRDYHKVAYALGESAETFRKRYTRESGKSPGQYISEEIMREAQSLLVQTDEPLKAVALSLGYSDEFSFGKQFKKIIGEPPGVYRRRIKNM